MRKKNIAIIGESSVSENSLKYKLAMALGQTLVDHDYLVINGGMGGIMEAACKGAQQSKKYVPGNVIAISPSFDPEISNPWADVVIPTGLDNYRNGIIAASDAVVAIGGKAGTLSEMAFAWTFKRMIIAFKVEGWSGNLANKRIDDRKRVELEEDKVFGVDSPEQVIALLNKYLHYYDNRHQSIIRV